jgi:hypothetical protein
MKKSNLLTILITGITVLVISSCNKNDDIFSYVDGYDAPLTEEKGATYNGDYFPFIEVNYWKYSGYESVTGEMTMDYQGEKDTESLDDSYSCTSTISVSTPESKSLNSGSYTLYPVQETETVDYETTYTTRYFQKATDAIYLRAIQLEDSEIIEVKNPVYLKIPFVVGDRWEAQPEIDMGSMMENELDISGDVELDMKCMLYVIGKEAMNWKGNSVETVRLDERAQAKGKLNVEEDGIKGSMSFDLQITLYLNYLEGVGLISQKSDLSLSMTGSFSGEGEKLTIDMKIDSEGNYILSSYYLNGEKSINIKNEGEMKDLKNRFPGLTDNPVIRKKLEKCAEITDIIQKVFM